MARLSNAAIVHEIRRIAETNLASLDPYLSQRGGTPEAACAATLEQEIEDCDIWLGKESQMATAGAARRRIDRQIRDWRAAS